MKQIQRTQEKLSFLNVLAGSSKFGSILFRKLNSERVLLVLCAGRSTFGTLGHYFFFYREEERAKRRGRGGGSAWKEILN